LYALSRLSQLPDKYIFSVPGHFVIPELGNQSAGLVILHCEASVAL
jgi:hypothetical protein